MIDTLIAHNSILLTSRRQKDAENKEAKSSKNLHRHSLMMTVFEEHTYFKKLMSLYAILRSFKKKY